MYTCVQLLALPLQIWDKYGASKYLSYAAVASMRDVQQQQGQCKL